MPRRQSSHNQTITRHQSSRDEAIAPHQSFNDQAIVSLNIARRLLVQLQEELRLRNGTIDVALISFGILATQFTAMSSMSREQVCNVMSQFHNEVSLPKEEEEARQLHLHPPLSQCFDHFSSLRLALEQDID